MNIREKLENNNGKEQEELQDLKRTVAHQNRFTNTTQQVSSVSKKEI